MQHSQHKHNELRSLVLEKTSAHASLHKLETEIATLKRCGLRRGIENQRERESASSNNRRTSHTYTRPRTRNSALAAKEDKIGSLEYQIARLGRQLDHLSGSSSAPSSDAVRVYLLRRGGEGIV